MTAFTHGKCGLLEHEREHGDVFGDFMDITVRIRHACSHSVQDQRQAEAGTGDSDEGVHGAVAESAVGSRVVQIINP